MKNILLISACVAMSLHLMSQAAGNAVNQQQNNNGTTNADGSAIFISTVGNINAVPTCTGNATNLTATGGTAYTWNANSSGVNFATQTRQYYNPYTGKYEDTPNNGGGQQAQASLPYDNSVIFDADVMINMQASSYTAIFSVTDFGKTVIAADSAMSSRLKIFTEALIKDSINAADIHIDFISMLPVYEINPQNKVFSNIATEVPAGFKIKKNVHVLFYDHTKLDQIITHAAKASIYDLVKVDYNVNDIQSAYDTLRKVAVEVIDMKRNTYMMMGFETTILTMAEGYDSKYPEERYESYTAYLQGNSYNNQTQNQNMQVQTAEKEQTVFYNKVPYKTFDRVLNADLAEPGVQFYYKLRVKCKMEHIEEKPEDANGKTAVTKPAGSQPANNNVANKPTPPPAGTYKPQVTVK